MSSAVSQYITKILCGNEGCLDFKQLVQIVSKTFTVADSLLHEILYDSGRYAIHEGKENASNRVLHQDSVIVAKTSLRVCQSPPGDCLQCENLHLCRYYVCGNCLYGIKCKNSHCLDTTQNTQVLERLGIRTLEEAELFCLLLQNDSYLIPEICSHYNKGVGEHGSCRFKTKCSSLHICLHYLQGDCKFGDRCKRAHMLDAVAKKILKGRGFSQENIDNIHKIYKNKFIILSQSESTAAVAPAIQPVVKEGCHQPSSNSISESDRNEICLFFLRGHCSFKDKCVRIHYPLPYNWQVLESDGVTWKDLPDVEEVEKEYCHPGTTTSNGRHSLFVLFGRGSPAVNFLTMTCENSPVRRLSTVSSVTKPPHFVLTTKWLWYWKDDLGRWKEYGQEGGTMDKASVTSHTLEKNFQTDPDSEIEFTSGPQKYILNLKVMNQQNIRHKTIRPVCRRPHFLSEEDVKAKSKSVGLRVSVSNESSSSSAGSVPSHWDKQDLSDSTDYKLVLLTSQMEDYQMIQKLFKSTMASSTIHSIKRIQNPSLWRVFQWQKEQMMKKNGGKPVDERHLFHGTDQSIIEAICEQNFDWRACGVNGTVYGQGSYFARDASYSHKYIKSLSQNRKVMFVALVLVGEFTKGCSRYRRPPQRGTSKALYDSCVDSERNPSIFVIFEKQQIYPEFLIEYI